MAEKKQVYETNVMTLPPLRLVLGEVPSPDPETRRNSISLRRNTPEMQSSVKKLIAHLKENQK
jgi:hypothetical protein